MINEKKLQEEIKEAEDSGKLKGLSEDEKRDVMEKAHILKNEFKD